MRVNIDDYEASKSMIVKLYETHGIFRATEMGVLSGVPLIAVYMFLKEEFGGFDDDIQRMIDFYGYTKIVRKK